MPLGAELLGEALVRETFSKMINIEKGKCSLKIIKLKNNLRNYEEKYNLKTKQAWNKYNKGELGDDFDIMEWMALFKR